MRIILIILLFVNNCSGQSLYGYRYSQPNPVPIDTLISDDFTGSSLSSNWSVSNPGSQTITVSGGIAHVKGGLTTQNPTLAIKNTGYGVSTLYNYRIDAKFSAANVTANSFGVYVGAIAAGTYTGQNVSTYASINFTTNQLSVKVGTPGVFNNVSAMSITPFSTSNSYKLSLILRADTAYAILYNLTGGDSVVTKFKYDFTNSSSILRPNIFNYSFGVAGDSDVFFDCVTVTSSQKKYPGFIFIGDSITDGYFSGSSLNGFPFKLSSYTSSLIQIMAGGGNQVIDAINDTVEIINLHPEYAFCLIGANNSSNFTSAFSQLVTLITALNRHSIKTVPLLIPNGGDPSVSGTYNNLIYQTFYSTFIDLWTTGWNTMNVGNGEMKDALHPTNLGMIKLTNIIKSAKPNLFPL